jgi:hypothetical protein
MDCLNESIKKTIKVFPSLEGQLSIEARVYDTGQTGAKEAGKEVTNVKQTNDDRTS